MSLLLSGGLCISRFKSSHQPHYKPLTQKFICDFDGSDFRAKSRAFSLARRSPKRRRRFRVRSKPTGLAPACPAGLLSLWYLISIRAAGLIALLTNWQCGRSSPERSRHIAWLGF